MKWFVYFHQWIFSNLFSLISLIRTPHKFFFIFRLYSTKSNALHSLSRALALSKAKSGTIEAESNTIPASLGL